MVHHHSSSHRARVGLAGGGLASMARQRSRRSLARNGHIKKVPGRRSVSAVAGSGWVWIFQSCDPVASIRLSRRSNRTSRFAPFGQSEVVRICERVPRVELRVDVAATWPDRPPLIIDESDGAVGDLPRAPRARLRRHQPQELQRHREGDRERLPAGKAAAGR